MKWCMIVLMVAGAMMARAETAAQNTEKVVITVAPPKTPPVVFPGYSVEKIILVTDRGVIIPWRITMPK